MCGGKVLLHRKISDTDNRPGKDCIASTMRQALYEFQEGIRKVLPEDSTSKWGVAKSSSCQENAGPLF